MCVCVCVCVSVCVSVALALPVLLAAVGNQDALPHFPSMQFVGGHGRRCCCTVSRSCAVTHHDPPIDAFADGWTLEYRTRSDEG